MTQSTSFPLTPEDYDVLPDGRMVFTATYHLKRGYCCQSGCRHCPYSSKPDTNNPIHPQPKEPI